IRINVHLSSDERAAYEGERAVFRQFLQDKRIDLGGMRGWQLFIAASARSQEGRRAMKAYRESKRIALGTDAKMRVLGELLQRHKEAILYEVVALGTTEENISRRRGNAEQFQERKGRAWPNRELYD